MGSLMGLAIGDALGAPIEFEKRDTYEKVTGFRSGGPFHLKAGQWTDDTSMALCLGYSLVEKKGFEPADIMKRFHSWWREGFMSCTGHCFDIGNTTKAALTRFEEKAEYFSGSPQDPATNGSIMRLAPVPLYFFNQEEKVLFFSGESSRLTHAPAACVDACRALGLFIHRALKGFSKEKLLDVDPSLLGPIAPEIAAVLAGSYRTKKREEISAEGLAHTCLEAALWAFYHTDTFNDGVLLAVNLGEDSDTTGAVFGQLAGAYYGIESIKEQWRENLWDQSLIKTLAQKLYEHFNSFYYEGENPTVDLIVINPADEVLLIRRSQNSTACPGMWAFPGGFIDSEAHQGEPWRAGLETPEAAALRELEEETNLKLTGAQLLLVGTYVGNNRDPRDNEVSWSKTYAYLYRIDEKIYGEQKDHIRGMDDAEAAMWVPLKEALRMPLAFDHNQILSDAVSVSP